GLRTVGRGKGHRIPAVYAQLVPNDAKLLVVRIVQITAKVHRHSITVLDPDRQDVVPVDSGTGKVLVVRVVQVTAKVHRGVRPRSVGKGKDIARERDPLVIDIGVARKVYFRGGTVIGNL